MHILGGLVAHVYICVDFLAYVNIFTGCVCIYVRVCHDVRMRIIIYVHNRYSI